mgnify:CR=1 FL=1
MAGSRQAPVCRRHSTNRMLIWPSTSTCTTGRQQPRARSLVPPSAPHNRSPEPPAARTARAGSPVPRQTPPGAPPAQRPVGGRAGDTSAQGKAGAAAGGDQDVGAASRASSSGTCQAKGRGRVRTRASISAQGRRPVDISEENSRQFDSHTGAINLMGWDEPEGHIGRGATAARARVPTSPPNTHLGRRCRGSRAAISVSKCRPAAAAQRATLPSGGTARHLALPPFQPGPAPGSPRPPLPLPPPAPP